jgi:flagellar hook-associated protein 2
VANTWETHAGTDVAGSFTLADGTVVAGTGAGQVLSGPATGSPAAGLVVKVTASAPGTVGTLTYAPGLAQQLATLGDQLTNSTYGSMTLSLQSRKSEVDDLGDQIDAWDTRLALKQEALQRQFTSLETALGQLKSQGEWLSGQLASLPSYG